jgi:hypothetical protein
MEMIGLRFRNFLVTIRNRHGIIPTWERRSANGIELINNEEEAFLTTDYDWSRRCQCSYVERQQVIKGPSTISIRSLRAILYCTWRKEKMLVDLSNHFNDYYAMRQTLIPENQVYTICKLHAYEEYELETSRIAIEEVIGENETRRLAVYTDILS